MAVDEKLRNKMAISGAIAGVATGWLISYVIMPILNAIGGFIPQVSLKLAEANASGIVVNIRQSLSGINTGLARWLTDWIGLTVPENLMFSVGMAAIGGALVFVAGLYIVDALNQLTGSKIRKMTMVILFGNLIVAVILGAITMPLEIGLGFVNVLIAFAVNAGILAGAYALVDKDGKLGLIPF